MISFREISSSNRIRLLKDFLVLELQTSGPDPARDRILALGMLRVSGGRIVNSNSTLVRPDRDIPQEILAAAGIDPAALETAPDYGQLAPSLARLLLGGLVAADRTELEFIRAMLEPAGFSGEISYIDVRDYAANALGDLSDEQLRALAEDSPSLPVGAPQVLRSATVRYRILQEGKRRTAALYDLEREESEASDWAAGAQPEELVLPEEDEAAEAERYEELPVASVREEPAPQPVKAAAETALEKLRRLRPGRRAAARPPRRRRRKKAKARTELLSSEEAGWLAGAVLCFLAALLLFPSWKSLLLLLAAALLLPLRFVRRPMKALGVRSWMLVAVSLVLVGTAIVLPKSKVTRKQQREEITAENMPAYVVLSWDEPGAYGTRVSKEDENGEMESFIAFHIPAGIYQVINNNNSAVTVTVKDLNEEEAPASPSPEPEELGAEDVLDLYTPPPQSNSATILANKSQSLTVDEEHYVTLSKNANNVVFQYLRPLPEQPKDNNAGKIDDSAQEKIYAYVIGTEVRMRRQPSVDSFIMATYDTGKEVEVIDVVGEWTAVSVDNRQGYIFSKYLTRTKPDE